MSIPLIVLVFVVAVAFYLIISFNRLVTLKNRTKEAWSDIDVQLKRRYNLIPNLVSAVKGYAGHEKELFEKVSSARSAAMGATTVGEKAQTESALSNTLKTLFAVSEAYPELKASTNFLELQKELTDTEDKVQAARRFYNANVRDLNTQIQVFPTSLIASAFGFKKMDFFQVEAAEEKQVPKVE